MEGPISRSESMVSQKTDTRPVSVAAYHDEHELNQMLPPKRELPFAKSSQDKLRANKSDAENSGPCQPKPLPASTPADTREAHANNAPEHQDLFIPDSQQSQPLTQTQPPLHESQLSPTSSQLQSHPYPDTGPKSKQPPTSTEQTNPSPEEPPNGANVHIPNERTRQPASVPSGPSVEEQFALYGSAPTQERIAFLENWMCELIEDDKFMALCQDVEATWRRFAFGMQR